MADDPGSRLDGIRTLDVSRMKLSPSVVRVVDSHTAGEPTRVVLEGWPQPQGSTMAERRDDLRARFDTFRRAVVCEPRGHEAMVGALLTPAVAPGAATGVVFFNNVGWLGMCGHGLIGVVRTLEYLGRLEVGEVSVDTPVGPVSATLHEDGSVTIRNVPSFCHLKDVQVEVPGVGLVTGDVAYGGNWFFITQLPDCPVELANLDNLTRVTRAILRELSDQGVTGRDGAEIDHVEISAPPARPDADCKNFVLCPGGEYDRSPCGTGTSAKMASLFARGELSIGESWCQESVTGSMFTGWLEENENGLIPYVRGHAYVTGETTLHFNPSDPFRDGFSAANS